MESYNLYLTFPDDGQIYFGDDGSGPKWLYLCYENMADAIAISLELEHIYGVGRIQIQHNCVSVATTE